MTFGITSPGRRFLAVWAKFVRERAVPILLLAVALTVAGLAYTLANITINTSTTEMLSEKLPFRQNHKALKAAFPQLADNIAIVIESDRPETAEIAAERLTEGLLARGDAFENVFYLRGEPYFNRNGLLFLDPEALQDLGDRLVDSSPLLGSLNQDPSLRGFSSILRLAIEESGDNLNGADNLARALDQIAETVRSLADGKPRPLSWRTLLRAAGNETEEIHRQFIRVKPILDHSSLQPAAAAIHAVREVAAAQGLTGVANLRLRMTGDPLMFQEELETLRDSMGLIGLISALLVALVLGIGVRSPRLVGAVLATLFMGLIWTATFATLSVGALNLISVAFAVLFIGLGVDFGIHYGLRYQEEIDKGRSQGEALETATTAVGGALTLCAVCTTIGFFSFLPTDYRGLSELGLISGGGMIIALATNLTVLPAMLTVFPLRAKENRFAGSARRVWPQAFAGRHRRAIVRAAVLLGLLSLVALPHVRFDDDPLNLRDPNSDSVATFLDLFDDPQAEPYETHVLIQGLEPAAGLAPAFEALPEIAQALTLRSFVPDAQQEKLTIIEDLNFFMAPLLDPGERKDPPSLEEQVRSMQALKASLESAEGAGAARLAQALARLDLGQATVLSDLQTALLGGFQREIDQLARSMEAEPVDLEDLPPNLTGRYLAGDGTARILLMPANDLRDRQSRLAFVRAVQGLAPGAIGPPVIIAEAGEAVVRAFREAMGYAFVLVTLLLLALLRSPRDSLLVLAPLILAALFTVAVAVLADIPFNFANVIVLPLLFGLGTNSGIHMVIRHREELRHGPSSSGCTPRAVLLSALTTLASFGALALSNHQGTASMGKLLTIAIVQLLICTLLVLPALLAGAWRQPGPGKAAAS